jgi:hypothetical protein
MLCGEDDFLIRIMLVGDCDCWILIVLLFLCLFGRDCFAGDGFGGNVADLFCEIIFEIHLFVIGILIEIISIFYFFVSICY